MLLLGNKLYIILWENQMTDIEVANGVCKLYEERLHDLIIARDYFQTILEKLEIDQPNNPVLNKSKENLVHLNDQINTLTGMITNFKEKYA